MSKLSDYLHDKLIWQPQIGDVVRARDRDVTVDWGRITSFVQGSMLGADVWTVAGIDEETGYHTAGGLFADVVPATASAIPGLGYMFYWHEMELIMPVAGRADGIETD